MQELTGLSYGEMWGLCKSMLAKVVLQHNSGFGITTDLFACIRSWAGDWAVGGGAGDSHLGRWRVLLLCVLGVIGFGLVMPVEVTVTWARQRIRDDNGCGLLE